MNDIIRMLKRKLWRLLWLGPPIGGRFKEQSIPLDSNGVPDLSYFLDSPEYYFNMLQEYFELKLRGTSTPEQAKRAYSRRVLGLWGLVARGEGSLRYAAMLGEDKDPEARSDGMWLLAELGAVKQCEEQIIRALNEIRDPEEFDSLIACARRIRSSRLVPSLTRLVDSPLLQPDQRHEVLRVIDELSV